MYILNNPFFIGERDNVVFTSLKIEIKWLYEIIGDGFSYFLIFVKAERSAELKVILPIKPSQPSSLERRMSKKTEDGRDKNILYIKSERGTLHKVLWYLIIAHLEFHLDKFVKILYFL